MIYLSSKVRKYKKGKGKQPMIKIDDWVIEKGEKAQGKIKITGYGIAMPATVICGVKDGPTILITAGIHSAEYVGIQAAMELAKE